MNDSFEVIAAKQAEHEVALSELYAQFARTFPVDADLWTSLSHDEARHAMWIDEVRQAASAASIQQVETTVRRQGIEAAITHARGLAERCRNGNLTRLQAHAMARDIENGLLERRVFAALAGVAPGFARVRDALTKETTAHRDKIVKAMARFAGRPA